MSHFFPVKTAAGTFAFFIPIVALQKTLEILFIQSLSQAHW